MNVQDLKKNGVCFNYSVNTTDPQIPRVKDVQYALRLTDQDNGFRYCMNKQPAYITNVMVVSAAVACEILGKRERDTYAEERVIAQAIVDLCPDEAKCLFNPAFAEAWATLGHEVKRTSREQLWMQCGCQSCRAAMAHEGRALACDD